MENAIRNAIIKFEQEFMGRGPDEVRAFVVRDLVVVRLKGVLTPAELRLAQVEDAHRGRDLIKQVRLELIEHGRLLLESVVQEILGVKVVSLHTDISTTTGESILLFTLDGEPAYSRL